MTSRVNPIFLLFFIGILINPVLIIRDSSNYGLIYEVKENTKKEINFITPMLFDTYSTGTPMYLDNNLLHLLGWENKSDMTIDYLSVDIDLKQQKINNVIIKSNIFNRTNNQKLSGLVIKNNLIYTLENRHFIYNNYSKLYLNLLEYNLDTGRLRNSTLIEHKLSRDNDDAFYYYTLVDIVNDMVILNNQNYTFGKSTFVGIKTLNNIQISNVYPYPDYYIGAIIDQEYIWYQYRADPICLSEKTEKKCDAGGEQRLLGLKKNEIMENNNLLENAIRIDIDSLNLIRIEERGNATIFITPFQFLVTSVKDILVMMGGYYKNEHRIFGFNYYSTVKSYLYLPNYIISIITLSVVLMVNMIKFLVFNKNDSNFFKNYIKKI